MNRRQSASFQSRIWIIRPFPWTFVETGSTPESRFLGAVLATSQHPHLGIKLGASLLQDAVGRAVSVSQNAGVRALLVHALHERAKQFYEHYGFQESPQHPMTLMLRLNFGKA